MLSPLLDACTTTVFKKTLPNWISYGQQSDGHCLESLTLSWQPNPVGRVRLLSQCRQLYTWCHAAIDNRLTFSKASATSLFDFIIDYYYIDGQWIFSLDDELKPLEKQSDAYALAFVMLAFSFYYRFTGDARAIEHIELTHRFLDTKMRHPSEGFEEVFPANRSLARRQNPHMHLLEGYLAAYKATKSANFLTAIEELSELAHRYFFDTPTNTLREFFDEDWNPDSQHGDIVEPGHHFEWVWLLYKTHEVTNDPRHLTLASQLWITATSHGLSQSGGVLNSINGDNFSPIDTEKRIWPITEFMKACCVIDIPMEEKLGHLESSLSFLSKYYLRENGGWNEYLDGENFPKSYPLAATTSYHLFLGLNEVLNWVNTATFESKN